MIKTFCHDEKADLISLIVCLSVVRINKAQSLIKMIQISSMAFIVCVKKFDMTFYTYLSIRRMQNGAGLTVLCVHQRYSPESEITQILLQCIKRTGLIIIIHFCSLTVSVVSVVLAVRSDHMCSG